MRSFRKSVLSLILVVVLSLSLCVPGIAYNEAQAQDKAEALNALSLFKGTDKGFELDRDMTRMEALIMMIRLTGNEYAAMYSEATHPFTDAPTWEGAQGYVAYAYENGLIAGTSATTLDPNGKASTQMFMTLVLRALGYEDTDKTIWENWKDLSKSAGIFTDDVSENSFLRGDMVSVSYAALSAKMQKEDMTLTESLLEKGTISSLSLSIANVLMGKSVSFESDLADIAGAIYADVREELHTSGLSISEITKENMAYYLGVDTLKIEEGIAVEPMMMARAHSVCLVRMKDDADIEKAKETILANVNPRKWICVGVEAENIRIGNIDNLIILVMDNGQSDALLNNFLNLQKISPDENGMMMVGDTYIEAGKAVNTDYVERFAQKLISVREDYLGDSKVYYAIIPEKSFYAKDLVSSYTDHSEIAKILADKLGDWTAIDLSDTLELSDYYLTDPHWQQDRIFDVVDRMGEVMDFSVDESAFTKNEVKSFTGSYGRKADGVKPETINWLGSSATENAVVDNFSYPEVKTVYDLDRLETNNPYDMFLSGATPLVTIENTEATQKRELVIFRDSYACNLAPVMLEAYSKITLVDLRYMASSLLPTYVDFTDAEVLFLYSDSLVNNMLLLK